MRRLPEAEPPAETDRTAEQERADAADVGAALELAYPLRPIPAVVKRRHLAAITGLAVELAERPGPALTDFPGAGAELERMPQRGHERLLGGLARAAAVVVAATVSLGGLASAGVLPDQVQEIVARLGSHLGIDLPGAPNDENSDPAGGLADPAARRPQKSIQQDDESEEPDGGNKGAEHKRDASGKGSSKGGGGPKSDDDADRAAVPADDEGGRGRDRGEEGRQHSDARAEEGRERGEEERDREKDQDDDDDAEEDEDEDQDEDQDQGKGKGKGEDEAEEAEEDDEDD